MTKTDNGKFTEENTLMANGRAKPAEKTSLSTFIYNKQNGTFLGRTAKSWAQIIVFYIVFYLCLAIFWLACLWIFLKTIDEHVPRYYGENTIIGANPGVGYQPWLAKNPESTLIKFFSNDTSSYQDYLDAIDKFLVKYNNTDYTQNCAANKKSNSDVVKDGKVEENALACLFDLNFLENKCDKANHYGFSEGNPCIFLTVNRLIGWKPEKYDKGNVPSKLTKHYKEGSIAFICNGTSESDSEQLGGTEYIPLEGIDGRYYPYAKMNNYHQPFAVVKFTSLPINRVVLVQCRAYANNIKQDEESKTGMVTFELLRQG